jgi:uncharacterized protein YbcC (UPF0753/DUF2309 family)/formate hydrogenlyase subunit 3/multisubunit Na+/H+ antiporter MnhD subunit
MFSPRDSEELVDDDVRADGTAVVIESMLVVTAVFAPLLGLLAVLVWRPAGLGAGRCVAVACGIAFAAALAVAVVSGSRPDGLVDGSGWLGLRLDRATALLLAAVTSTGAVVASFARRSLDLDGRANRFFVLFAMLVVGSALVVAPGGWITLLVGWVSSSWALVGLVGHRNDLAATRRAQRHIYRALAVGDAALLLAVVLIVAEGGVDPSLNLTAVVGELASSTVFGVGVDDLVALLVVVAGASRSALVPFQRWLVTTLAAPTPVSALVHAGFVSGAGLLLIRFGPLVLESFVAVHLAFALAVATVVAGVGAATKRVDVKGKLAWSTVAQMGFMVLQCTVGAFSSAVFHIIGHGMYKATMFLGAGDAVSAGLRSTRRASPLPLPSPRVRMCSATGAATAAIGLGWWILPPDVSDGGVALVVVFAWATAAHGVWGWLGRGAVNGAQAVVGGTAGCCAAVFGYLAGLRLVEHFVKPSFADLPVGSGVDVVTLLSVLAAVAIVAAVAGVLTRLQPPVTDALRTNIATALIRLAHPGVAGTRLARRHDLSPRSDRAGIAPSLELTEPIESTRLIEPMSRAVVRSKVRADVARAATIIAPAWPLTSFVAVNPLGGLEQLGFEEATAVARRQLRARTHLSLEEFRHDHQEGLTTVDDVNWAIESQFIDLCSIPPIRIDGRTVSVNEIFRLDMLHSPDLDDELEPHTALEHVEGTSGPLGAMIDATIFHSAAQFAGRGTGTFQELWRNDATQVAGLRRHLSGDAQRWIRQLSDDPAEVIATAFAVTGVDAHKHVAEMRGHLCRLRGWAGYAKWRTDWAQPDEQRRSPSLIDLVAARSALEAACVLGHTIGDRSPSVGNVADQVLAARVDAVIAAGFPHVDVTERSDIEQVLSHVEPFDRNTVWLRAQERNVEQRLLSKLDRLDPGTPVRLPDAQLVFCIDVRSEGLRRHLEAAGPYETIGFAGFFGVAMSVRRLEWQQPEPRCPVLVKPSVLAVERPTDVPDQRDAVEAWLSRDRLRAGATAVHASTKYGLGAPFVMAEAAGWIAGPVAAVRTLVPSRRATTTRPPTVMELDSPAEGGLDLEQRVFTAEAVLKTMGLTKCFAPLVVLCGHASDNVNNPHATALDCGACAGASGQDNARTVVRLLNDVDVRSGLRERTIDIPDTTHFAAGMHDTISDHVQILDTHAIPPAHHDTLAQLIEALDVAAQGQSAQRAQHLPGPSATVRNRGGDWAQIRSEWGLARNNSFIIGPRSMTAGLDLDGRSFLHTYNADEDPDGKVLETIMTAPLVVAHWISAQYYFSTVAPDIFGAGDKLIHNIASDTGVISGEHGDLRVGLPLQSTHIGERRHHQPIRLLAVIQAPLERIECVIDQNPILTTLVGGSWIRVAGRSHPHERWSIRTPNGTWSAEPRPIDINNTLETS